MPSAFDPHPRRTGHRRAPRPPKPRLHERDDPFAPDDVEAMAMVPLDRSRLCEDCWLEHAGEC